jgi:CRISPR-associated protein Csb3
MQLALKGDDWQQAPVEDWLFRNGAPGALPFNFDAILIGAGSARDVGFSFDPLRVLGMKSLRVFVRPLVELCAFVGLQRFRPAPMGQDKRFCYVAWEERLVPEIASAAACAAMPSTQARMFEFRLLYRTDYLKSFLPAKPIRE